MLSNGCSLHVSSGSLSSNAPAPWRRQDAWNTRSLGDEGRPAGSPAAEHAEWDVRCVNVQLLKALPS